jgi:hypothetical protein
MRGSAESGKIGIHPSVMMAIARPGLIEIGVLSSGGSTAEEVDARFDQKYRENDKIHTCMGRS